MTEPNFVNTCNKHLGQVFCLPSSIDLDRDMSMISLIENESIKNKIVTYFNQQKGLTSQMKTYCLLGLKSVASIDNLNIFMQIFSKEKECSIKTQFKKVINWPKIETKASYANQKLKEDCNSNLVPADLIDHCFKLIPLMDTVPDYIKNLATANTQSEQANDLLQLKLNIKVVSDHLYSLSILFNLIIGKLI